MLKVLTRDKIYNLFLTFTLFIAAGWLRLKNLGYSDFQGDEIKALFLPIQGQTIVDFLLMQRKGPVQFLVTYFVKIFDPLYLNQFLVRLPFALASLLAVFVFYKFVSLHSSKRVAFYSALFMAFNGFFVAFARIAQYQSFVILFCVLALYFFSLAIKNHKWHIAGMYYGMTFWALSLLSHYDGIFIFPFVAYILFKWFKEIDLPTKTKLFHLVFSGAMFGVFLALFYLPFIFSLSASTLEYWADRLEGGEQKLSSSIITFKIYNPKLMFYIYLVLTGVFACSLVQSILVKYIKAPILSVLRIPLFHDVFSLSTFALVLWALFPFAFMEVLTSVPGTHIYTYLIPTFIIISHGLVSIEQIARWIFGSRLAPVLNMFGVLVLFVFNAYLAHKVFVDNTYEYPWEEEKFMFWTLNKPNVVFHLSLFGFPYYRHWEEIGEVLKNGENNGYYSTNERKSIARYYVPFAKDTNSAGHFVYISNPQTFTNQVTQEKAVYWFNKYQPIKTYYNKGREVTKIYYMPAGSLEEIKALGY